MLHYGNISNIQITPNDIVDVVIGGSPCQDLSVAGKRAGLKHAANGDDETTRSGLFIEQIRIMKEMRELDKASGRAGIDIRCRYGVWENVPGALSSNHGEDFRIVLEEFCKIADPNASVPRPANGKWNNSGCIMGDDYSVAWRIMDARYNGVPQRRRRISLVADFAGQSAPKILFDEEGMHWDFETSQEAWKRASAHAEGSTGRGCAAGFVGRQGAQSGGVAFELEFAPTLRSTITLETVTSLEGNTIDRNSNKNGKGYGENEAPTLNTQDRHAVVYDARGNGDGATCCTITGDHCNRVTDYTPLVTAIDCRNACGNEELSATLQAKPNGGFSYNCINPVCYEAHRFEEYREGVGTLRASGGDCGNGSEALVVSGFFDKQRIGQYGIGETSSTLSARDYKDASDLICTKTDNKYIVRRLTPLECSRLQGLQDDWCVVPPQETVSDEDLSFWKPFWDEWMQINVKKPKTENQITKWLMSEVSESAQYQMYGNGIAAPQWFWVCGRIIETYGEKKPTMASLFDGTGSFPWIWNSILEGEYTVWSSEVNPEAIRVSKYRIG